MTDKKSKNTETARKIWLAGIGAYGRAFSEVQEGLSKATKSSSKVFDELVQKGEVLETIVSHKGKEAYEKVSDRVTDSFDKVSDSVTDGFDMDERISKMRARLKGSHKENTGNVSARLDDIEAKLDEVLKLLKPKKTTPRKKAAPKKTSNKKASPKKPATK